MSTSLTIFAAVVLYNASCESSSTCRALAKTEGLLTSVLVYDNCINECGNNEYCKSMGWTYLGGKGNVGISRAYNCCIEYLHERKQVGILCLFDEDTTINGNYFTSLITEAAISKSKILVPIVISNGVLLSPCLISKSYITKKVRDEKQLIAIQSTRLSAINSGMAIDLSLFENYRYDENIFLDGVDHKFLKDMKLRGHYLQIMPYRCVHEFSGDGKHSIQGVEQRFRIFVNDYHYILRNSSIAFWYLVGKRALHLALRYKSLVFIKILANCY